MHTQLKSGQNTDDMYVVPLNDILHCGTGIGTVH